MYKDIYMYELLVELKESEHQISSSGEAKTPTETTMELETPKPETMETTPEITVDPVPVETSNETDTDTKEQKESEPELKEPPTKKRKKRKKKTPTNEPGKENDSTTTAIQQEAPTPASATDRTSPETDGQSENLHPCRKLKILIRGLKTDVEIPEIEKSLTDFGLRPMKIEQMRKRRGQELKLIPLYLVILTDVPEHREILKVDRLLDTPVRVERFRGGRYEIQCFRCQGFGHTQRNCTATSACTKCAGAHFSYLCTKPRDKPPTCINCQGVHLACFSGCGARPRKKTAQKKRQHRSAASSATRFLHIVRELQELLKDAELVTLLQSLLPAAKT
ncbi:uncharacterized protein [Parasteatoda tepidariorum]|uniref:uncharacterized protein n=1 Tax=Parasteatoda tepidariorum TaxID=114398 RepID=UPI001C720202|nr:uncharacterized protein LOC122272761 [Parasteatoda tepidariorum]